MYNHNILTDWQERFTDYLIAHHNTDDASHDIGHFERVWKTARYINMQEGCPADDLVLLAAAYFHDWVSYPKNHPQRSESSRLCAERTGELLAKDFPGFPPEKIAAVQHAIHAHSYSAQVTPLTPEAQILQDADRMEALGAIGLARTFYVAGRMGSQLFEARDPLAENRSPDDTRYALDHFKTKLLRLPALMNTTTGQKLAQERADYLQEFLQKIHVEIQAVF